MEQQRRQDQLQRLWSSVLRSLVVSVSLLVILLVLTFLVAVVFYVVNRNGHTNCDTHRQLRALDAEYNATLNEVVRLSKIAKIFKDENLTRKLIRLQQLGKNYVYKNVKFALEQHELKPNFTVSLYYAVTLVSLIGYGDVVGASELQYFCASLCILIVVPVWYMYHYQLYQLFYFLQLYCHIRWIKPKNQPNQSNRTMLHLWSTRMRHALVYRRSHFYLSNFILMIIIFPLCLAVFAMTNSHLTLEELLWLTVQSIFHIGLGDTRTNLMTSYAWAVTFLMISICFLIYFQCFSFIMMQPPALRLSRITELTDGTEL